MRKVLKDAAECAASLDEARARGHRKEAHDGRCIVSRRICIMCDAPYVGSLGLSAFRASSQVSPGVAYRVNLCAECVKAAHAVRAVGALGGPVALVEPDGFTQWICSSGPWCRCVGHANEWDECACVVDEAAGMCTACDAPMTLIDFETGEPPTHARDTLPAPEDNGATS